MPLGVAPKTPHRSSRHNAWVLACTGLLCFAVALWLSVRPGSSGMLVLMTAGLAYLLGLVVAVDSPECRYMGWTVICRMLSLIATWGCPAERCLTIATSGPGGAPSVEMGA